LIAAVAWGVLAGPVSAQTTAAQSSATPPTERATDVPVVQSPLGSYMAGRVARTGNDIGAATTFYQRALAGAPGNSSIEAAAFEMAAVMGDMDKARDLAARIVGTAQDNRMARLLLGIAAFKNGKLEEADGHVSASMGNPIADLTANLTRAWMRQAQGRTKEALDLLAEPKAAEPILQFYRYHRALLADVAGRNADARQIYDSAGKTNRTLRFALAAAHSASNAGDNRTAQALLQAQTARGRGDPHPLVLRALKAINAGETLPLLVSSVDQGLAETYYGLGDALTSEGGFGPGAILLQFALYLQPDMTFALASMANVFETAKRYDLANALYERVPKGTPLETAIDLRKAVNLSAQDRFAEAEALFEDLATREPANPAPLDMLGSMLRQQKRYDEAVRVYDRLIARLGKPEPQHWTYYYARGTSHERAKNWPKAEADLRLALKLSPDQASVLNYLGYSWVDQGKNLKQGLAMIEKAVRLKPDDGYIIDSLGWAHFRLGNFKDAVKWLERAVELRAEDPILNDHLGDAYWRVGREREARFQWDLALSLAPEKDERPKIERKLAEGMPALSSTKAQRATRQVQRAQQNRRRTDLRDDRAPSPQ
jgi:tetratricopeptide (TPR) repeat protein